MKNKSYVGFTLAETLITLAIVGLVAVLTLPNIMSAYKMKAWNSAEAVFQSRMEDAVVTMQQTGKLEGITTTEEFVSELKNHMNIRNTCESSVLSECFISRVKNDEKAVDLSEVSTASDLGHEEYDTNAVGIQTAFGVDAIIAFDKNCDLSGNPKDKGFKCITAIYDLNGIQGPNKVSKDIRGINTTIFDEKEEPQEEAAE